MIEQDTIKLLRECDSGVRMGVSAIDDVMDSVKAQPLRDALTGCRTAHEELSTEICDALHRFHDEGKKPNPMASSMSRMKTEAELMMNRTDATVADLITDGCNMGVKSLSRYLNQYQAADESAKDVAKRLIGLEEQLAVDVRPYL